MRDSVAAKRKPDGPSQFVDVAMIDDRVQARSFHFSARTCLVTVTHDEDGVQSIARAICDRLCPPRTLHLVAYSGEAGIGLGSCVLSLANLEARADELKAIGQRMAQPGMIHLHLERCPQTTDPEATMLLFGYLTGVDVMISCRGEWR